MRQRTLRARKGVLSPILQRVRPDLYWFVMILPAAVLLVVFFGLPILSVIYTSLQSYSGASTGFAGLSNFFELFGDPELRTVARNTVVYTTGVVIVEFLLGFLLAILLSVPLRGIRLLRTAFLIPLLMPTAVVALSWQWMLVPQYGVISALLKALGFSGASWTANPALSLATTMMVDVWLWTPLMMMILLGGLMSVPTHLYEAARVDGASNLGLFRHITMPWMRYSILLALLLRTIDALRTFDIVQVLTGGGPGYSSELVSVYIYKVAFQYFDFGRAAAVAILATILLLLIGMILVRVLRREYL